MLFKSFPRLFLFSFASCLGLLAHAQVDTETVPAPGEITSEAADTTSADEAVARYPQIKAAFDLFKSRDFKGAEDVLKKACEENKELPPAGVIVGTWYFTAKAPAAARQAFERAVRDSPGDPEAYVVFGDNAIQQRRFTDGFLLYSKANDLLKEYDANPQRRKNLNIRAQAGMAAVLEAREQWKEAENSLRQVLQLDNKNLIVMSRLARALFKQGDEQAAYDVFKQMYEIDPIKSGRYEILMARLYQQAERDKNAEKLITIALKNDPDTLNTQLAAATWALETGRNDMANSAVQRAAEIEPNNVQVKLIKGIVARTSGQNDVAAAAFQDAFAEQPNNPAVLNQLAIALASQDNQEEKEKGLKYAQMAAQLLAKNRSRVSREAGVTLAWVLFRLGKISQATQQLQNSLQGGGLSGDSAYMAAEIFHNAGKSDVAVQLLQNAIENTQGIFPMKSDAESLLQKIKG